MTKRLGQQVSIADLAIGMDFIEADPAIVQNRSFFRPKDVPFKRHQIPKKQSGFSW